ncbi:MAG: hypothetical protein GYA36_22315 [Veillonellaceae bacterium]|nr:hypothetical protein [Veillonellaceae bacterium]
MLHRPLPGASETRNANRPRYQTLMRSSCPHSCGRCTA